MIGWIITGIIIIPFIVMAIFLLKGKGAFLIAGYNTMSSKNKAAYDEKALCKAVGWLLIVLSVLMLLFPLAMQFQAMWLFWVSFILFFLATIGFAIYANTGNRFRKNAPDEEAATNAEREPMSRGKKLAVIIGIIITVQIFIGVGIMIFLGERDPVITAHNDSIQISALYGISIDKENIAEVALIEKSMRDIGVGTRTNGYSTTGQALKGNFSSSTHGQQLLFVYSSSSPTIQISRTNGVDIFISFRSSEKTREIYQLLSTHSQQGANEGLLEFRRAESVMSGTPLNTEGMLFRDLSAEEINTLFHNLEVPRSVNATFLDSGVLDSITVLFDSETVHTGMVLGVGKHHGNTMIAFFPGNPTATIVQDTPVTALFADISHPDGLFFQASFNIDDVPYNLTLWEPDLSAGKARLSETVYSIISNKGIDLSLIHD